MNKQEVITVNRSNWTGLDGKILIDRNEGVFTVEDVDGTFTLVEKHDGYGTTYEITRHEDGYVYHGFRDDDRVAHFASCGVGWAHLEPVVAFAQMMWNL